MCVGASTEPRCALLLVKDDESGKPKRTSFRCFWEYTPVGLGLVASLARPGGNLTGINFFNTELTAKRLELLRTLVPAATRVAVLVNPTAPAAETTLR
jgi:hypothetical protein